MKELGDVYLRNTSSALDSSFIFASAEPWRLYPVVFDFPNVVFAASGDSV